MKNSSIIIAIAILLIIIVLHIILCFILVEKFFKWGNREYKNVFELEKMIPQYQKFYSLFKEGQDYLLNNKYDEVDILSFDGYKLHGYLFLNNKNSKNFIVFSHGYHSTGLFDFSKLLEMYKCLGFNALIIDQRAHAKSDSIYTGFGQKEKHDLHSWVDFLIDSFGKDISIVFQGMSMGSATIMYSLEEKYNCNIKALILDCGYNNVYKLLLLNEKNRLGIYLPITTFTTLLIASLRFKINLFKSTESVMKNNEIPTLFLHTLTDEVVPHSLGLRNFFINKAKINEFVSYEYGRHTEVLLLHLNESKKHIEDFLKRNELI